MVNAVSGDGRLKPYLIIKVRSRVRRAGFLNKSVTHDQCPYQWEVQSIFRQK